MNTHLYKNLVIEVYDDPTYQLASTDNNSSYSHHHFGTKENEYSTSKHGIIIRKNGEEINSCVVVGAGGRTSISQNSSIMDDDQLLICCGNKIFCLNIPSLTLKWDIQVDQVTCFQIYPLDDDYVVHGELEITRLDRNGNIKWQFIGSDIFVSLNEEEVFRLHNDYISLFDFSNLKYKLDFNGKVI